MSPQAKKVSNPISSGGGGVIFETQIQAAFAVLMLARGFAPCLPAWPISKIKLQAKHAGFNTDDLIIFTKDPISDSESKILAQVKRTIKITEDNKTFGEVIYAAWSDFSNPQLFNSGRDFLALVTGPLSANDIKNVRELLEMARHSENARDFLTKVEISNFSSDQKRAKLSAFRVQLNKAKGIDISEDELWRFMKAFHLLGYDLDIKAGVTLSLLHSLIGQHSPENAHNLWLQVVNEVQSANQYAGTLDIEKFPGEIRDAFRERPVRTIPKDLLPEETGVAKTDYASVPPTQELAIAMLLGGWDEALSGDKKVVEQLSGSRYADWIGNLRDAFLQNRELLNHKNAKWEVTGRLEVWNALGQRLFDDHLEKFKDAAISVLKVRDPKFELTLEERFAASIHGKVLSHSNTLRKGLAESLALLGNRPDALTSSSRDTAKSIAVFAVREILKDADWVLWASLNDLLPLLAEAAPREFLDAVENALIREPCPFDTLFAQESSGVMGTTYISGLLWALETLAWDPEYLIQGVSLLGDLAARDPGGKWANRPAESLTTILLPWLPQTCASITKRETAVKTLIDEQPDVAWNLLVSLLPRQHQTSSGSRKPTWWERTPDDCSKDITREDYWKQVAIYAELALHMAKSDPVILANLADYLGHLPPSAQKQLLEHFSSAETTSLPEVERLALWNALVNLVLKHRKYADAKWAMKSELVDTIASVAEKLAPAASKYRHQRLFNKGGLDLYEEKGNYKEQQEKLETRRQEAIEEICREGGIQGVIEFAKTVESTWEVGLAFGMVANGEADVAILPELLTTSQKSLVQFAGGFVWGRFQKWGWKWVDELETSQWKPIQTGQLLAYLPFVPDTWKRAKQFLGKDESPYWTKTHANPFEIDRCLEYAVDHLIEYGRPIAAIRCIKRSVDDNQLLDAERAVRALLAVPGSSENVSSVDTYEITELIKALQNDSSAKPDDLFRVEWRYLTLLDGYLDVSPKTLEQRLADEPDFFCELIQAVFRSDREGPTSKEPSEEQKRIAESAYQLLYECSTAPGTQKDGTFDGNALKSWVRKVKERCKESGHTEIAMSMVGQVLIHTPHDPDGLWIHHTAAKILNAKDAKSMREGFTTALYNSRGAHFSSSGKEEQVIAEKYRIKAEEIEIHGYHRLADALRRLASLYQQDSEREAQGGSFNE